MRSKVTKDAAALEAFIGTVDAAAKEASVTLTRAFVHAEVIPLIHGDLLHMYKEKYQAFEKGSGAVKEKVAAGDANFVWENIAGDEDALQKLGEHLNVSGMSATDPASEDESGRHMQELLDAVNASIEKKNQNASRNLHSRLTMISTPPVPP